MKMNYSKISLFLGFLVAVVIFCWSSVPAEESVVSFALLPTLYHIGIFFLLGSFLLLFIWQDFKESKILVTTLFILAYASLDELHQFFVPGRSCSIADFAFDALGMLGSLLFVLFCRMFRKNN